MVGRGGVVNSKNILLLKIFFNIFWPKSNWPNKHFPFDLNPEKRSGLKVSGPEINFIITKLLKSENPRRFVIPVEKFQWQFARIKKWHVQLLYNKVDFGASDFEAAVLLQIEVKWKFSVD